MDRRIKLSPRGNNNLAGVSSGNRVGVFGPLGAVAPNNPMIPLQQTKGIIFPYTPEISVAQQPNYESLGLTHTNQDWYYYTRTPSLTLTLSNCIFTAQTPSEARYTFAVIHWARSVVKMEFGVQARIRGNNGLPPPLMSLSGYGNGMFNKLPVIVKDYSYVLPSDVDFTRIQADNTEQPAWEAWVPLQIVFNFTLIVQNPPTKWRDDFDLEKFKSGELLKNGGWF